MPEVAILAVVDPQEGASLPPAVPRRLRVLFTVAEFSANVRLGCHPPTLRLQADLQRGRKLQSTATSAAAGRIEPERCRQFSVELHGLLATTTSSTLSASTAPSKRQRRFLRCERPFRWPSHPGRRPVRSHPSGDRAEFGGAEPWPCAQCLMSAVTAARKKTGLQRAAEVRGMGRLRGPRVRGGSEDRAPEARSLLAGDGDAAARKEDVAEPAPVADPAPVDLSGERDAPVVAHYDQP